MRTIAESIRKRCTKRKSNSISSMVLRAYIRDYYKQLVCGGIVISKLQLAAWKSYKLI